MALQILNTDYQTYTGGTAQTFGYNSPSGTNTLLVVVVMGYGTGVPLTRDVSYAGSAMTTQVYTSSGKVHGTIFTLVSPTSGANSLYVNFTNGSLNEIRVIIYTLGNVSNAPVDIVTSNNLMNGGSRGAWTETLAINATSSPYLCIDGFYSEVSYGAAGSGQTQINASSYKSNATSMVWSSNAYNQPNIAHVAIAIRADKSFTITDTIASGDTEYVVKGFLIKVIDTVITSESYSQIRKVFMSLSDTFVIKDRGWFGSITIFSNIQKTVSNWLNINK